MDADESAAIAQYAHQRPVSLNLTRYVRFRTARGLDDQFPISRFENYPQRIVLQRQGWTMLHYIAVLMPQPEGIWRVHFPDFPGCRAEGAHLEQAIAAARQAVYQRLDTAAANGAVPFPRSIDAIIADDPDWIRARGIDWRRAVISLVPFADIANAAVSGQRSNGVAPPRNAAQ